LVLCALTSPPAFALWETQPIGGIERDLRLGGSKRELHINFPQVLNRSAYKETYEDGEIEPLGRSQVEGEIGLPARHDRRPTMTTPAWDYYVEVAGWHTADGIIRGIFEVCTLLEAHRLPVTPQRGAARPAIDASDTSCRFLSRK
jgi:hypothetical protein